MILPDRKHPPHLTPLDHEEVVLLITVCTKNRRKILAHEWVHQLLLKSWALCHDYPVGRYVILPDHIHAFVGENHLGRHRLENWIAAWKSFVSLRWPTPKDKPIWQRSFWDRQIHSRTPMTRNGFMCETILCATDWFGIPMIGRFRDR